MEIASISVNLNGSPRVTIYCFHRVIISDSLYVLFVIYLFLCLFIDGLGWLVGFGFNGPLRQYFSLYQAVS